MHPSLLRVQHSHGPNTPHAGVNRTKPLTLTVTTGMYPKLIAIAGNIGAGKTRLTGELAEALGWEASIEEPEKNAFTELFYADMQRWGFTMQISFLYSRIKKLKEIRLGKQNVVQDRTLYEDIYVFAQNLRNMGLMLPQEYDCYKNLFLEVHSVVKPPDLLIYLRAPVDVLLGRIRRRNRPFEEGVQPEYLAHLNELYEEWIAQYELGPVMICEVNSVGYMDAQEEIAEVVNGVMEHLS